MNQVNIIGNIGSEPEVRSFSSGKKVMRFSLAVNGYTKDGKERPTTWIPCETWDDTVERFIKCSEKGKLSGRKVQITGSLALNEYERKVGETAIKERKLYVKVHQFALLSYAHALEVPGVLPEQPQSDDTGELIKRKRSRS
jgi:single-strand DNA-binding protein